MNVENRNISTVILLFFNLLFNVCCGNIRGSSDDDGGLQDGEAFDSIVDAETDSKTDNDADSEIDSGLDAGNHYDASGAYKWHTFYGSDLLDDAHSVTTDQEGNIYVAGLSLDIWVGPDGQKPINNFEGSGVCAFILKLLPNGKYQWHAFYSRNAPENIQFAAITIDLNGYIYVTGTSNRNWSGPDGQEPLHAFHGIEGGTNSGIFVLQLTNNGLYQWHTFYGSDEDIDYSCGITLDDDSNISIAGVSYSNWYGSEGQDPINKHGQNGLANFFILKLSENGQYEWHTFFGSDVGALAASITMDDMGDIYITGSTDTASEWLGPEGEYPLNDMGGGDFDIFILKISSEGDYLWHTFFGSGDFDFGRDISAGNNGNVYITGESYDIWMGSQGESPINYYNGGADIVVLKLDDSGSYQWHGFWGADNDDLGRGIAANDMGEIYITGSSESGWSGPDGQIPVHESYDGIINDLILLKMSNEGAYQWHTFYGSSKDDHGSDITLDEAGGIFVAGESNTSWSGPGGQSPLNEYSGDSDITILKLRQ